MQFYGALHPFLQRSLNNMIGMIYGPTFNSDNKIPRGWKIQTDIISVQVQFNKIQNDKLDFRNFHCLKI